MIDGVDVRHHQGAAPGTSDSSATPTTLAEKI
jgi:hypothetical protein